MSEAKLIQVFLPFRGEQGQVKELGVLIQEYFPTVQLLVRKEGVYLRGRDDKVEQLADFLRQELGLVQNNRSNGTDGSDLDDLNALEDEANRYDLRRLSLELEALAKKTPSKNPSRTDVSELWRKEPDLSDRDNPAGVNPKLYPKEQTWPVLDLNLPHLSPKTPGQERYLEALRQHPIVFGVGPAGTGKTYLAIAWAVQLLSEGVVQRLVLTRPAVEAGENLGFLPGDLSEKIGPYLRPLTDALSAMLGPDLLARLFENDTIEIAPLAYMRGRTLDNALILLDEAQNTTREQMKMFLTRMGYDSRMIITGDITQIDLRDNRQSGLKVALRILSGIEGIGFSFLTHADIVRNPLVTKILEAYEKQEK